MFHIPFLFYSERYGTVRSVRSRSWNFEEPFRRNGWNGTYFKIIANKWLEFEKSTLLFNCLFSFKFSNKNFVTSVILARFCEYLRTHNRRKIKGFTSQHQEGDDELEIGRTGEERNGQQQTVPAVASQSATVIKQPRIYSQLPLIRPENVESLDNRRRAPSKSTFKCSFGCKWAFYESLSIVDLVAIVDAFKLGYSMRKMIHLLGAVARQNHIFPASEWFSERVFSLMGNFIPKKRNRLNRFLRHVMFNETIGLPKQSLVSSTDRRQLTIIDENDGGLSKSGNVGMKESKKKLIK